jgi:hypothetical protein
MVPQRLEKIESAPGNGLGSKASNPQDLVHTRPSSRGADPWLQSRWKESRSPVSEISDPSGSHYWCSL